MLALSVIPVFVVLLSSFFISLWCAWSNRSPEVAKYLYSGNTPVLALSSCVGTVVSMAISFTALLSAGYTFGWQILFTLTGGSLAGLVAMLRLLKHERLRLLQPAIAQDDHSDGASYLVCFQSGRSLFPYFYIFYILFYSAMLTTEVGVLRGFLTSLFHFHTTELVITMFMIVLVCYAYVFIGGFRAVLITDYFQLLVVLAFVGLLLASTHFGALQNLPPPLAAKIHWTPWRLVLLHFGVFSGAFSWTFANIDQWYRTAGTLPVKTARTILIQTVIIVCALSAIPVLAGSYALTRHATPVGVTNEISLLLVQDLLLSATATVRFTLVMALVCAALTTLNTYIMTIQQLYYETSIRIYATQYRWYILEFLLKWKQVRGVGLILTATCFIASFFTSSNTIYWFGVVSLCGYVFSVPFLLSEAANISNDKSVFKRLTERASLGLLLSIALFPLVLVAIRLISGPISLHLYSIPAAAGLATLGANVPLLMVPLEGEVINGKET